MSSRGANPDGTVRIRGNEEAIRAFEEVKAAIEHLLGAETVPVRVSTVGAPRHAAPWRALRRATLRVRTDWQAGDGELAAGDAKCPKRAILQA